MKSTELLDYINSLPLEVPPLISKLLGRTAAKEEAALVARHRASKAPMEGGLAKVNASEAPRASRASKTPIAGGIATVNASKAPLAFPPQRPKQRCRKKTRPENATHMSNIGSDAASAAARLAALALCGASLTAAAIASPLVSQQRKREQTKEAAAPSLPPTREPCPEPEIGSEMECDTPPATKDESPHLAQASVPGDDIGERPPPKLRRIHERTSHDDKTCSVAAHVCEQNAQQGCSSCHWSCRADCTSDLCPFQPCEFCLTFHVATHVGSEACIALQRASGLPRLSARAMLELILALHCYTTITDPWRGDKRGSFTTTSKAP